MQIIKIQQVDMYSSAKLKPSSAHYTVQFG